MRTCRSWVKWPNWVASSAPKASLRLICTAWTLVRKACSPCKRLTSLSTTDSSRLTSWPCKISSRRARSPAISSLVKTCSFEASVKPRQTLCPSFCRWDRLCCLLLLKEVVKTLWGNSPTHWRMISHSARDAETGGMCQSTKALPTLTFLARMMQPLVVTMTTWRERSSSLTWCVAKSVWKRCSIDTLETQPELQRHSITTWR